MSIKTLHSFLAIFTIFVIALVAYLLIVHWLIYYRLDEADLKPSDQSHSYVINRSGKTAMVYLAIGDSLTAGTGVDDYSQAYPF